MHGWAIKQDNKMVKKSCLNLSYNVSLLCFDKLTSEHNNKKHLKFLFCGSISLTEEVFYSKPVSNLMIY